MTDIFQVHFTRKQDLHNGQYKKQDDSQPETNGRKTYLPQWKHIAGSEEHQGPASQDNAIAVKWRNLLIPGINGCYKFLVFDPAAKMNDGK